jgi:hypothetical protein
VVTTRALEYPCHVLVKARGRPLADGRPLPSFNEVHVIAEHTELEGQVGVGDLIQGVRGDASRQATKS